MTFDTYANFQTEVANWLKRTDLTASIPSLISIAEARIFRDLADFNPPLRAMEQTQTGTASGSLALPTGYVGTKRFRISVSGQWRALPYKTPEQMAPYTSTSEPLFCTTNGNNLEFGPPLGTSYSYEWIYYKKMDSLTVTDPNWLLTNAPDVYLYATLLQAEPYLKNDKRVPLWAAAYQSSIKTLEMANRKDRQSGTTLRMRTDAATP